MNKCKWSLWNGEEGLYEAECRMGDDHFIATTGDFNFKYCPYCGKEIAEVR